MAALLAELKASGGRLHLMGLVSDGGVHSHQNHLVALAQWAQAEGVPATIHAFLDGRDTEQKSADGYLQWLTFQLRNCPLVTIGSLCGRYTAMDRDKRWDRVERAWKLLVDGIGEFEAADAQAGIQAAYGRGETDEFVSPTRLQAFQPIQDGDGIIFFNFRADRARELCHALVLPDFSGFKRARQPRIRLVTFTAYERELEPYVTVAYPPQNLANILGELVARQGWKQLRTAETEKYAHVTYFFNGGREVPYEGEDRILVPSPKVATYELQPEMSAHEVVRGLVKAIDGGAYRLLVCNLANPDMVGHTGDLSAAAMACAVVDDAIRQIAAATLAKGGALFITADHGNCECMRDEKGNPHTAHTLNPVPAVLVAEGFEARQLRAGGVLADVAPTLLKLMGVAQPEEMDGASLY
jgi:2,3-bisphosphoglycerate-independent phosphoglycerate mutase